MSAEMCTSDQAIAALGYLNRSFAGYPMTPDEQRPYLRLFRGFTVAEVQDAIDVLARSWTAARRPMPNDVAQVIQAARPKVSRGDGPFLDPSAPDVTAPGDVGARVGELRADIEMTNDNEGTEMTDFAKVFTDTPLTKGSHKADDGGACLMEKVSILWALNTGKDVAAVFSDLPECTNAFVARNAQAVNDLSSDEDRPRLNAMIPRLLRARRTDSDHRINTRLAIWAARKVLHLVEPDKMARAVAAIEAAEAWLENPCEETRATAADAYATTAAAYAAAATTAAAAAYATAAAYAAYATAAAYAAYAAAAAYAAYAATAAAEPIDLASFLDELLDQWEEACAKEGEDTYVPQPWEDAVLELLAGLEPDVDALRQCVRGGG